MRCRYALSMSKPQRRDPVRAFALDFTPLRKMRKGEEIPRAQLARAAGMDPITLWRIETNRTPNVPIYQVIALSRAMGVPLHELFVVRAP